MWSFPIYSPIKNDFTFNRGERENVIWQDQPNPCCLEPGILDDIHLCTNFAIWADLWTSIRCILKNRKGASYIFFSQVIQMLWSVKLIIELEVAFLTSHMISTCERFPGLLGQERLLEKGDRGLGFEGSMGPLLPQLFFQLLWCKWKHRSF